MIVCVALSFVQIDACSIICLERIDAFYLVWMHTDVYECIWKVVCIHFHRFALVLGDLKGFHRFLGLEVGSACGRLWALWRPLATTWCPLTTLQYASGRRIARYCSND